MALVALLALAAPNADAALGRMATYLQKPFAAAFVVTRTGMEGSGTGTLIVQRPNRMLFTIKWGPEDYEIGWSENRTLEMVRFLKTYHESGPYPRLYQPESHLSDLPRLGFPLFLLAVNDYVSAKVSKVGEETVGGVLCDHVKGSGFDAWVAKDGRPMRFRYDEDSPLGPVSVKFEFSKWTPAGDISLSRFEPAVPGGFRPHALPRDPYPLQPGMPFPANGWVGPRGSTASLKFERPTLVVVSATDCEASTRAASALRELESTVAIWTFTDSGRAPAALNRYPAYRDASQRTLARLMAPGTPFFMLVGKDGKIIQVWLGYNKSQSAEFIQAVKAAAK